MTVEEKKRYDEKLHDDCMVYCRIDYDDDAEIVDLMIETVVEEMKELIPGYERYNMTNRQRVLLLVSVKELYDNRDKYSKDTKTLSTAVSSMLLKEMYK